MISGQYAPIAASKMQKPPIRTLNSVVKTGSSSAQPEATMMPPTSVSGCVPPLEASSRLQSCAPSMFQVMKAPNTTPCRTTRCPAAAPCNSTSRPSRSDTLTSSTQALPS